MEYSETGELWDALVRKGYTPHHFYNINAETLLQIISSGNTAGIFYNGHAFTASPEALSKGEVSLTVRNGSEYVPFESEVFEKAKQRLQLRGISYQPTPSLRFFHLGTCYGVACWNRLSKMLDLPPLQRVAWEFEVGPPAIANDYLRGHAAQWVAELPSITASGRPRVDWEQINADYQSSLVGDELKLYLNSTKVPQIARLGEIERLGYPATEPLAKILEAGRSQIKGAGDLISLTRSFASSEYSLKEELRSALGEIRLRFVKEVLDGPLKGAAISVEAIKDMESHSDFTDGQRLRLLEEIGIPLVRSPNDFIELFRISAPKSESLAYKVRTAALAKKHEAMFKALLGASGSEKAALNNTLNVGCGRFARLLAKFKK